MSHDPQAELAKIQQAIKAQEDLRGIVSDEQLETTLAALRQKATSLQAEISGTGTGAIAQGEGATAVVATDGGMAFGRVEGSVYIGPEPRNPAEALTIYHQVLLRLHSDLPLRGIDIGASDPTAGHRSLSLVNVYIDLNTTHHVPLEKEADDTRRSERPETRPLGALEAVANNRCLTLLGDPGGGKSTFVKNLACGLAGHALDPAAGWLDRHLPGWPVAEADRLPLVVILRDFAASLPESLPRQAEPNHLWDFITARLKAQNLEFVAGPLCQALEKGQGLVLLDGLDEVPTVERRAFVRDAVTAFMRRYHPDNRYLVTCRTLSYQPSGVGKPDLRLPASIPDFILAPFDEGRVDRFIEAWYTELASLRTVRSEDQPGLTQRLKQAVRRPDLWRLAPNPLLLTVMALVHTHKGRLPDDRALLYEETVDILLWRWEQSKADTPRLRQLLQEAGRSDIDLKRVLGRLAYEAHAQAEAKDEPDHLADIGEAKLQKTLADLKDGDHNWARSVIETMKLRAGLLLERTPEVFTFPHRTFQEYLAGAYLSTQASFAQEATRLAETAPALWREVILLAVGRLIHKAEETDKPLALVGELCPDCRPQSEIDWRKAWLASDVLLEMGLKRVQDCVLGRDLLARAQTRLAGLLEQGQLSPVERAAAGRSLAGLGDPRPGVGLQLDGVPDIVWCEVPKGTFSMGSDKAKDEKAYDDEMPQHQVDLPAFRISQYPITNVQYQVFVDAGGYQEADYWPEAARAGYWQGGQVKRRFAKGGEIVEEWASAPADYGQPFDLANHPVVGINWWETLAYTRWLTEELRQTGYLKPDEMVTLPSEAQWEKAARGTDGRIYPWGPDPDPNRANYDETGIGTTSAVGCFPDGASPYDCLDMSGNVWEWTRSINKEYPYDPTDGREDLEVGNEAARVLRGGSFNGNYRLVRCAVRRRLGPHGGDGSRGFRVVCVSVSPSTSGI